MKTFNDSKSQHLEELEALISSSLSEKELEDRLSDYHDNDIAEILEKPGTGKNQPLQAVPLSRLERRGNYPAGLPGYESRL